MPLKVHTGSSTTWKPPSGRQIMPAAAAVASGRGRIRPRSHQAALAKQHRSTVS